jgi:minor extracellular serine protease Vpr
MCRRGVLSLLVMVSGCAAVEQTDGVDRSSGHIALADNELSGRWFVELTTSPLVSGGSRLAIENDRQAFRVEATAISLDVDELAAYETLFNGFSVEVDGAELAKLRRMGTVKALYPVIEITAPEIVPGPKPELETALDMTGASIAQSQLGLTGEGVKVAVIDTGVDYHHPDLGGCFGAGCAVVVGYDFVGDAFGGADSAPAPDEDPDDCGGHGTHVAGIVGARGEVTGVAPGVTFGAYRVFGCTGSTSADIMLAAMERAYADGMQVVNMSIGSSFQWPDYPTSKAADSLVERGVIVVASAGNSGAAGLYASSAPSVGSKVISVANFDNTHMRQSAFQANDKMFGFSAASGAPEPPTSGSLGLASTGTPDKADDGCAALTAGSLTGKAALIRRGTCPFHTKSLNAQNAGAAAVILYNNAPGFVTPNVAGEPAITIPVISISAADGAALHTRNLETPVTFTWTDQVITVENATGGLLSSSSSYGPTPDLQLKPDIGAPGGLIYSTFPLEAGGYATLTGTSMSSPHVAGAVALLLEARPGTKPADALELLSSTARPAKFFGNPASGLIDVVHRQGAGMLRIDEAVQSEGRISPSKLSLGEVQSGTVTQTIRVRNDSSESRTYDLTHEGAVSTGKNAFMLEFLNAPATLTFSPASVTVPAGGSANVSVTFAPHASMPEGGLFGGYVVASARGVEAQVRIPYLGFRGDYQAVPVMTPADKGYPWLAKLVGTELANQTTEDTEFTMQGEDLVYLAVHVDHPVRTLRGELIPAPHNWDPNLRRSPFRAFDYDHVGRNSTATGFYTLPFDGLARVGQVSVVVPNGRYVFKLSALKALGDERNPAHWESWTSPAFIIKRP